MEIRWHGILSFLNPPRRPSPRKVEKIEKPMNGKLPPGCSCALVVKLPANHKAIPSIRARAKK